jgi:hypothetical protein
MRFQLLQIILSGFMNNIFSGKKYLASPAGASLKDETNNRVLHLERSRLIHSYDYESAGDLPGCLASLPVKFKSCMQYTG